MNRFQGFHISIRIEQKIEEKENWPKTAFLPINGLCSLDTKYNESKSTY